jgi:XTP/dITP diphosphohydrolase
VLTGPDPAAKALVLASGNRGKLAELSDLLKPLGFTLRPQSEWGVPEAVEDAPGFVENALIKARNAARHTGLPAIADDSGLVVPALEGAPGIHSARYAGQHGSELANNSKLLREMEGLTGPDRAAYFHCAMVFVRTANDPVPLLASASWHGVIASSPGGTGGFGYDPLFWLPERRCTAAELSGEEKNRISHRGQASRRLMALLEGLHGG